MYYRGLMILCCLILSRCNKPSPGFDVAGPISQHLAGEWTLKKVVSPSQIITGSQIGYTEILVSRNEGEGDFDKIYRNDTLVAKYKWGKDPWPVGDAKKMTVLVSYVGGMKRFFKIYQELGKDPVLETSAYLPDIGGVADSVKYYYSKPY